MASWHQAQRAWERTQPQLFFEVDDLEPNLPEVTNGWSAHSPLTADLPPAAPTDPRTDGRGGPTAHLLPDRVYGEAGNGISFSHNRTAGSQTRGGSRASLPSEGV